MDGTQHGDLYDALYREHFDMLIKWCHHYVGYDPALISEAEDWVHEAFRRAIRAKRKFLDSYSQYGWLVLTCRHIIDNDLQKKAVRDKRHCLFLDDPNRVPVEDTNARLEKWAEREAQAVLMSRIVGMLSRGEHKVYDEYFVQGKSEQEVADAVGKPLSAVKAAIRRIRKKAQKARDDDLEIF